MILLFLKMVIQKMLLEMKVEWKGLRDDKEKYAILLGKIILVKNI
jgi:hypothetical protein